MSVDIYGFIETSYEEESDLGDEGAWMSCLDLLTLGLPMGDECRVLFGETKAWGENPTPVFDHLPVAHRRGLPANPGEYTRQQAGQALKYQGQPGLSVWGFTHISYDELREINWAAYGATRPDLQEPYGWGLLFKLPETLATAIPHLRLVVWFVW